MPPEDKDAALFPRRFDGRWAMIHRPSPLRGGAHMWISYSPDLRHWGDHQLLLEARDGAWWDAGKIGLGPPPLETAEGWLVLLPRRPRRPPTGRSIERVLRSWTSTDPRTVLHRTDEWVFGPAGPLRDHRRRRPGGVPVRLGRTTPRTDTLLLYYGAADSVIGVATARLSEVLRRVCEAPMPTPSRTALSDRADAR